MLPVIICTLPSENETRPWLRLGLILTGNLRPGNRNLKGAAPADCVRAARWNRLAHRSVASLPARGPRSIVVGGPGQHGASPPLPRRRQEKRAAWWGVAIIQSTFCSDNARGIAGKVQQGEMFSKDGVETSEGCRSSSASVASTGRRCNLKNSQAITIMHADGAAGHFCGRA
jgi:hypothetical protein